MGQNVACCQLRSVLSRILALGNSGNQPQAREFERVPHTRYNQQKLREPLQKTGGRIGVLASRAVAMATAQRMPMAKKTTRTDADRVCPGVVHHYERSSLPPLVQELAFSASAELRFPVLVAQRVAAWPFRISILETSSKSTI